MATSHWFSCAAACRSEAESSLMSCATTSSLVRGAAASTRRTTQPSSVLECRRAPRRAAVNVASPHWVGGNVLTKPNRMLIIQVPSDRTAPRERENEASRNKTLRLTGSVYSRANRHDTPTFLAPANRVNPCCSNCRPCQVHQKVRQGDLIRRPDGRSPQPGSTPDLAHDLAMTMSVIR